ncbi:hypothetical protein LINGRAHAP2_LOCUS25302 [Linum grandiflorum]
MVQRRPRRRGGVRRSIGGFGPRVLAGEREAPPGRGGDVGGGGGLQGGGLRIGGDPRDRSRAGPGSQLGEGSGDVSESEPEDEEGGAQG